jgi:Domain of unknown function (DUF5666)
MKRLAVIAIPVVLAAMAWAQAPDAAPQDTQPTPSTQDQPGQWGGRQHGPGVGGTITAINGNSITIKTMDGKDAQITATDQTKVRKDREKAVLSDLKVGDVIMVRGQQASDGTWQAEMIGTRSAGAMGTNFRENLGKKFIVGDIKSINGTQLEIARPDGVTQTIAVDENTSFKKDNESITLADFKPGDHVFGRGEVKNDVFVAAVLNSGQPRFMRRNGGNWQPPQQ